MVHLIRNSLRYASKKDWPAVSRDLKPVYQAEDADQARIAFEASAEHWQGRYPAMVQMWERSWEEFIPFLDHPPEIRELVCTPTGPSR